MMTNSRIASSFQSDIKCGPPAPKKKFGQSTNMTSTFSMLPTPTPARPIRFGDYAKQQMSGSALASTPKLNFDVICEEMPEVKVHATPFPNCSTPSIPMEVTEVPVLPLSECVVQPTSTHVSLFQRFRSFVAPKPVASVFSVKNNSLFGSFRANKQGELDEKMDTETVSYTKLAYDNSLWKKTAQALHEYYSRGQPSTYGKFIYDSIGFFTSKPKMASDSMDVDTIDTIDTMDTTDSTDSSDSIDVEMIQEPESLDHLNFEYMEVDEYFHQMEIDEGFAHDSMDWTCSVCH